MSCFYLKTTFTHIPTHYVYVEDFGVTVLAGMLQEARGACLELMLVFSCCFQDFIHFANIRSPPKGLDSFSVTDCHSVGIKCV